MLKVEKKSENGMEKYPNNEEEEVGVQVKSEFEDSLWLAIVSGSARVLSGQQHSTVKTVW